MNPTLIGIDPGVIHTGIIKMDFQPLNQRILLSHAVSYGLDVRRLQQAIATLPSHVADRTDVVIEGYRSRSNLQHDHNMIAAVREMQQLLKATALDNMGIKQVIKKPLMELLGAWKWSTPTNHQDLRSAARIALLYAFKDAQLNDLIFNIVRDHLEGRTWNVIHLN